MSQHVNAENADQISNFSGKTMRTEDDPKMGSGNKFKTIGSDDMMSKSEFMIGTSNSNLVGKKIGMKEVTPKNASTRRSQVVQPKNKADFNKHKPSSSRDLQNVTPDTSIKNGSIESATQRKTLLENQVANSTNKKKSTSKKTKKGSKTKDNSANVSISKLSRQTSIRSTLNKGAKRKERNNPLRQSGRVSALGSIQGSKAASKKGGLNKYKKKTTKKTAKPQLDLIGLYKKSKPTTLNGEK